MKYFYHDKIEVFIKIFELYSDEDVEVSISRNTTLDILKIDV